MINVLRLCPKCGTQIPADARPGICPACLLERGLGLLEEECVAGVGLSTIASAKADDPGRDDTVRAADRKKAARPAKMLADFGDYALLEENRTRWPGRESCKCSDLDLSL